MANIGQMVAKLSLDNADFLSKIKESSSALGGLEGKTSSVGSKIASGVGKTITGIGVAGLGAFGGAATIATTAMAGLGIGLGKLASDASAIPGVTGAFEGLTSTFEGGSEAMLSALQQSSAGMVSNIDLMKSYNSANQLVGEDFANRLPEAMNYLSKVSAATGQDMGYMLDSMVKGVGRLSPMILDNLGIQVDMTEAYDEYAASIGKSTDELSKSEQQTAIMNKTMELLAKNTALMPDVAGSAGAAIGSFKATMENLKNELGVAFLPTLTGLMDTFSSFASTVVPAVIPVVELFGSAITGLMTALEPILGLLGGFAEGIGKVAEAFQAGELTGASVFLTKAISDLAEGLEESLPGMIETGVNMIMSIVQGMSDSIPALMPVAMTVLTTVLDSMITALPQMLTIGVDIITNVIDGIATALPLIMTKGTEIVIGLLGAIIASIPSLITSGIGMIQAIIDGVLQMIPVLIEKGPELVIQLLTAILSSATQLLQSGTEMVTQIINGIVSMVPTLVEKGPEFVTQFITAIVSLLPELLTSGVELLVALVNGIVSALPQLVSQAPVLIAALVTALIAALPEIIGAGADMIVALVEGITSMITNVVATAPDIISGFVDGIKVGISAMASAGADLMMGLVDGIVGAVGDVIGAVTGAVNGIISTVKGLFGSHSPSKVFMAIGEDLNKGLAIGIKQTVKLPEREINYNFDNMESVVPEFKQNNYNLTMPTTANAGDVRMAFELMEAWGT